MKLGGLLAGFGSLIAAGQAFAHGEHGAMAYAQSVSHSMTGEHLIAGFGVVVLGAAIFAVARKVLRTQ
jgi:hypothetical protein